MLKSRKKRCWVCVRLDVIKWGYQKGKQRFKSKECGALNIRMNSVFSRSNRFIWFRERIIGKQTLEQLCAKSGYSSRTLRRYFAVYLRGCLKIYQMNF